MRLIDTGCKLLSYTNRRVSASSTFHFQFTFFPPSVVGNPGRRCRTCQLFYVDDFGNLIPIVDTHSVFSRKLTHILVTVPCQIRQSWALGRWRGGGEGGGEEDKIWLKFKKKNFKFDKSGPLLATAQNYLLHSSLPLCSLLLTNCEGSHSVRLFPVRSWQPTVSLSYVSYITKDIISYHQSSHYILGKILNYLEILQNSLGRSGIFKSHQMLPFCLKCTKIVSGWGSAPDPAGGAYSAPPDPLAVGWGEGGRGGEGEGRGEGGEGEGREGEGREGKNGRTNPPG